MQAPIISIEDPDDLRVAPYRAVRERDLTGRGGGFIAEGEVVLERLLIAERHRPVSLLVAANRVAGLERLLVRLPADVPVYSAGQAVMDAVVGFHIHRGVLALGRRAEPIAAEDLLAALPPQALVVVLCGIANHDNMGGLFRNAAAFGADAVILDAQCCDPLYRKAIRVSVGAALTVRFARLREGVDVAEILAQAGFEAFALSPRGRAELQDVSAPARCAIMLGAEGPGLSEALLARVRTVRIGMAPGLDSLNVATASGIVLHHLTARRRSGAVVL